LALKSPDLFKSLNGERELKLPLIVSKGTNAACTEGSILSIATALFTVLSVEKLTECDKRIIRMGTAKFVSDSSQPIRNWWTQDAKSCTGTIKKCVRAQFSENKRKAERPPDSVKLVCDAKKPGEG
jgi:hypothetical protein